MRCFLSDCSDSVISLTVDLFHIQNKTNYCYFTIQFDGHFFPVLRSNFLTIILEVTF